MSQRNYKGYTILDAVATTATGNKIDVKDFQHITISFATASSANLTVKFQGSIQEDVDFSSARSATNAWDYIEVIDLQDGAAIDGDTGIACAGTDDFRMLQLNINGLTKISATVTARSAGSVTLKCVAFTNQ